MTLSNSTSRSAIVNYKVWFSIWADTKASSTEVGFFWGDIEGLRPFLFYEGYKTVVFLFFAGEFPD